LADWDKQFMANTNSRDATGFISLCAHARVNQTTYYSRTRTRKAEKGLMDSDMFDPPPMKMKQTR
jgi:hypothetical protein